jgi:hypothetical protein
MYFRYGTTALYGSQTSTSTTTTVNVMHFSRTISVTPNTTYFYQLVVQNVNGTVFANGQFTSSP